jgi:hypothetical protein
MHSRSPYVGMAVGLCIAALTLVLWRTVANSQPAIRLYSILCCPEYPVFALLADLFGVRSNTGARLLLAVIHVVYCVALGGFVGLTIAALLQRRSGSQSQA